MSVHSIKEILRAYRMRGLAMLGLLAAGVGITLLTGGGATYVTQSDDVVSTVGEVFGLDNGKLVHLKIDRTPGQFIQSQLAIEGKQYTLDLHPQSLRTDNFVFRVQLADGTYEDRDPGVARTLRGTLRELPESRVAGSILETGLAAKIEMGDGQVFFIEPLNSQMDLENADGMHVLYTPADTQPHECGCGVTDKTIEHHDSITELENSTAKKAGDGDENKGNGPTEGPTVSVAELAVDADFEYFSDYGTEQATLDRMELIVNIVNGQYEADVEITHMISGAIVRTSEPDPYTSTDPCGLLTQFRSHWLNNQGGIQRDVAHLFTGKDLDQSVIGIAWTLGAICNSSAYCLSQSDFNGSLACATDLTAHELGHLWDGSHCSCTSHTMNAFITCANQFHPTFTIPDIIAYRNTRNCLDSGTPGGNPPPNDDWSNAINVNSPDFMVMGTNVDATTQTNEQQLANTGSTAWWYVDITQNGMMTIDTSGSNYDTQLHIYTGFPTSFASLMPVVNNDDVSPGVLQSEVTFAVSAGERYEIRVGGWRPTGQTGDGSEGNIVLNGVFTPDKILLGDCDCNGTVNLLDVPVFIDILSAGDYLDKADINGDGVVNLIDVNGFIAILNGG